MGARRAPGRLIYTNAPSCSKKFRRKTRDSALRPHKAPDGWNCSLLRSRDHIDQRGTHFLPFARLQSAIRIDPELLVGKMPARKLQKIGPLVYVGHAPRVDVVNARTDLVWIVV